MYSYATTVEIIEIINTVAGIAFNLLLLYAIARYSRPHLGTYKYLITTFTLLDLYLVILHVVVRPRVLRNGNIHANVTDTILNDKLSGDIPALVELPGRMDRVTAFWIGCQSLPFTLLGIHFLYRYWSVRRPHLVVLFSSKAFVLFLISITLGGAISWYTLCLFTSSGHDDTVALLTMVDEYERIYGKRIENAWILMDHWRNNEPDVLLIAITSVMDTMMVASLAISCSLAILTFQHIRNSYKMSVQATELQRKLLVTLCAQSAIPMLFVYWPYVFCINNSFLRIPGNFFHEICIPLLTSFPVWDPIIVMCLFTDYRRGLMGILRKPRDIGPSTMNQTTTFVYSTSFAPTTRA